MNHSPSAFLQSPDYGARHPQQVGAAPYTGVPAPLPDPILSVSTANQCTLNKALQNAARIRGGQFVQLVVPRHHSGEWYLDTRPKPGAGVKLPVTGRALFRVAPISARHFLQSRPAGPGFHPGSITNTALRLLHFRLGPEVEGHPGYYRLLRVL